MKLGKKTLILLAAVIIIFAAAIIFIITSNKRFENEARENEITGYDIETTYFESNVTASENKEKSIDTNIVKAPDTFPEIEITNPDSSFSEIYDINMKAMNNIVEYGDKFCTQYVTTSGNINISNQVLAELKQISDDICKDDLTEYDKVKSIAYWVADNIYYDLPASETNVDADIISLEHTLEGKKTTCAGYSNIFSAMCNLQGIYCVNLRGVTKEYALDSDELINSNVHHEWTAAIANGEWVFVDTTWMSLLRYQSGKYLYYDKFLDKYFDMSFETMSTEHRIDSVDFRNFGTSSNALK